MKTNIDSIYNASDEISCLSKDAYYPLYKAINEMFNPLSIADLGCRVGHLISLFKENNNINVLGVDYFSWNKDAADENIKDSFVVADLRDALKIDNKYDIVISTEVGEHIDKEYSSIYLENIKSLMTHDSKLIITWSPAACEQHLNPLNRDEFFLFLDQCGLKQDVELTNTLLSKCEQYGLFTIFHWYFTGNMSVWTLK